MSTPRYTILTWFHRHLECFFWLAALIILFFLPVQKTEISLCPFTLLGFGTCPGCGIGHSIHYALRLSFSASFQHHPMGIFAVIVIFIRIKQLIITKTTAHETQPHQPGSSH